ncbi:recombinase family protein [Amycolatopsis alkalitolerans]|uniref:recombinase family protein n=1 Tax=Amycolatopsis alkalitolerans TaxID=2547244 RepID=UPI001F216736|nr:recombinase family protein [Amycolatopsis alkalitolerans]
MTVEIDCDPWATLDGLLGVEAVEPVDKGIGPVAFYGRCSTEDNQDPETSHGWQVNNAQKFVEPLGGRIAADYFDVGQSRSVPWERRGEAGRLLAALKDPARGWDAVVVGEGTRCWFGNQFSLIAPKFAAYGVDLWVPELGGKFDPRNPSHKMLMSVLGSMSKHASELRWTLRWSTRDATKAAGRLTDTWSSMAGRIRTHGRRQRATGCGCSRSMGTRRRWCGGSSPSTWRARVIGPLLPV